MSMCVLALKYAWDVNVCIGFEICTRCLCVHWLWNMYKMSVCISFEICMRCICVYWLWNMYKMYMCVLALKYVRYVYVCIGFEICTRFLCVYWLWNMYKMYMCKMVGDKKCNKQFRHKWHQPISDMLLWPFGLLELYGFPIFWLWAYPMTIDGYSRNASCTLHHRRKPTADDAQITLHLSPTVQLTEKSS